jgi:hypothetical protein
MHAQRQALQARRASRRHEPLHYTALLRRRSEGSENGGVIFRRQLSRRLQAHVGPSFILSAPQKTIIIVSAILHWICFLPMQRTS